MIDLAYCHNSESHIWLNNTIYSHEKPLAKFLAKSLILQNKKLLFWQQICWVPDYYNVEHIITHGYNEWY